MELLLFEFGSAGVPVADLAVEAFFDGASGAIESGLGDVRDLNEMRTGKVRRGPTTGGLVDATVSPAGVDAEN